MKLKITYNQWTTLVIVFIAAVAILLGFYFRGEAETTYNARQNMLKANIDPAFENCTIISVSYDKGVYRTYKECIGRDLEWLSKKME